MKTGEKVISEFICNLRGANSTQVLKVVKGDTDRMLRIRMAQGDQAYPISPDCFAVLLGRKADGASLYNSCRIRENAIEYDFTPLTCSTEGLVHLQIRLYGGDQKLLTTLPIRLEVFPSVHDAEEAQRCQDEQTALDQLVNDTRSLQLDLERDLETGRFQGKSAYELARDRGYDGTETEWLSSLSYDHSEEFTALSAQVRQNAEDARNAALGAEGNERGALLSARKAKLGAEQAQNAARDAEHVLLGKLNRIPIRQVSDTVLTLKPWEFFSFGEVEGLDLSLEPETEDFLPVYGFRFQAAKAFGQLKLPGDILWTGDHTVEPGKLHWVWILAGEAHMRKA